MEDKEETRKKQQQRTPIIDGDARPDIELNPEEKRDHPIPVPGEKDKKTTKNRVDNNSLEDFRDAL